ncbi:hypothetical protein IW140_000249 [Coemansia sp. RSA 1813]|nr:hypothetical protein EV178_000452 [Coemansia sp. RSA 1646]KAJ1773777.1 hypothetical protein LPJ74_000321 [Coemansia sp. RSA 1843]KAJ2573206.1 hypothetical protein IW140_000249 [Coemansia sp. RSA 1813]
MANDLPSLGAPASYISLEHISKTHPNVHAAGTSIRLPPISSIAPIMNGGAVVAMPPQLSAASSSPHTEQPSLAGSSSDLPAENVAASVPKSAASGIMCFNCGVESTSLWRRDDQGNVICNACGLYFKLNNKLRPMAMWSKVIKRRNRRKTADAASVNSTTFPGSAKTPSANRKANNKRNAKPSPNTAASNKSKKIKRDPAVPAHHQNSSDGHANDSTAANGVSYSDINSAASLCRSSSMPLQDQDANEISTSPQDISTTSSPLSMRIFSPYQISAEQSGNVSCYHASSDNGYASMMHPGNWCNSTATSTWTSPTTTYVSSPTITYPTHSINAANNSMSTNDSDSRGVYCGGAVKASSAASFAVKPRPAASLGLESLIRAAGLTLPAPSFHNHRSTNSTQVSKKRSISQVSHESMLDSLATVAAAEISLSKRQALEYKKIRRDSGSAATTAKQASAESMAAFSTPTTRRIGDHPEYRKALERECELLRMGQQCD